MRNPCFVLVALIVLTTVSKLTSGSPLQFMLMKENMRCSILFQLACRRRIMAYGDLHFRLVAEPLQVVLPGPVTGRVTPAAISAYEPKNRSQKQRQPVGLCFREPCPRGNCGTRRSE